MKTNNNPTFYGNEISDYGYEHGRVDYRALANSFNHVLCNDLAPTVGWENFEQVLGWVDNSEAIEELQTELDEVSERLEEATEEKQRAESNFDELDNIYDNINELLEKFDNFEYEANEVTDFMSWNDFDTPNGDELDSDTVTREIDGIDFWSMRNAIEEHQSLVEEQKDGAEEAFNDLEKEVEELTKRKEDLEAQIELLEEEQSESNDAEVFQWYIIDDCGYNVLKYHAPSELVWYCECLDIYLWGVTHWGTAWDYVLTDIECEKKPTEEEEQTKEREEEEAKPKETTDFTAEELDTMIDELVDLFEELEAEEQTEEEPREDEPSHTPTMRDASGQPYTIGYTVKAIPNRFGVPCGFVGKVTDIVTEDGFAWVEVKNSDGTLHRALSDDWESLADSDNVQ